MANSKRRCKHCKTYVTDWLQLPVGTFCNAEHAIEWTRTKDAQERARKVARAAQKREIADARDRIASRGELTKKAQAAFNAYIRARDKDLPCISCGRHHQGQYHAGHYMSTGAHPELRFDPLNVHKQCAPCNNHLSGNLVNYRINLIAKIGIEQVQWLEGPHDPRKYTMDDLRAIAKDYRAATREIMRQYSAKP